MKIKEGIIHYECYINQGLFEIGLFSMGWSLSHKWVLLETEEPVLIHPYVL